MSHSKCYVVTDSEGRELKNHGNYLFPIASYDDYLIDEPVAWHWHDEIETGVITSGSVIVSTNLGKIIMKKGEAFFFNPGIIHSLDADPDSVEPPMLHSIVFNKNLVGGRSDSIFTKKYVTPIIEDAYYDFLHMNSTDHGDIIRCIEGAWELNSDEPEGFELYIRNHLSELFFKLGRLAHTPVSGDNKNEKGTSRIKQMVSFIHLNFHENISLSDIAASANISESEALREFNSFLGVTPVKFLIDHRLSVAQSMLMQTDEKISEIAFHCGFSDTSYFTKAFREAKGLPPAKFRKQYKDQES